MKNNLSTAAGWTAEKNEAPANARRALENIDFIERVKLPKNKGWAYYAVMNNGDREVIRAKATRAYDEAHLHSEMVNSGKTGLGAVIGFGQKPSVPSCHLTSYAVRELPPL